MEGILGEINKKLTFFLSNALCSTHALSLEKCPHLAMSRLNFCQD